MNNKKNKSIVVYVNSLPVSGVESVKKLSRQKDVPLRILLLRNIKRKPVPDDDCADIILDVDFSKPLNIAMALQPYMDELLAITCRSESNIARFISVIPHVPYLLTPSTESLRWASDKYEMRKRFKIYDPDNTPRFTLVKSNSKAERDRLATKVGFPLIVKPTNLAASTLVSVCYHEEELETTLRKAFRKLKAIYNRDSRIENPQLMAEEFIEGVMYSLDSYVDDKGNVEHCPMVRVKTGKDIGHDDFYNYLRITPTKLKPESISLARKRVEIGIHALGLRNITTHSELLHVDGEWKIIEIGPRIGGHRHNLHMLSCEIDHSLNDLLVRIPEKRVVPRKCKGFASVMRYYPQHEGIIDQIIGIKKIQGLASFEKIDLKAKVGDRVYYSKNGGKGVFDLTLYNEDYASLLADIRRIEQLVEIKIKNNRKSNRDEGKLANEPEHKISNEVIKLNKKSKNLIKK